MVDYLIMALALCLLYLLGMAFITRIGRKQEFDREYQWLVRHIESMSEDQADTAIINFSDRWEGHINHFSLSFHISRLVRLRLNKRFR
jgi:hypothetical protein